MSAGPAFPVGMRVLLVDDDPLTLKVVGEMLRRCNYEGEHRGIGFSCLALHRFCRSIYSLLRMSCMERRQDRGHKIPSYKADTHASLLG